MPGTEVGTPLSAEAGAGIEASRAATHLFPRFTSRWPDFGGEGSADARAAGASSGPCAGTHPRAGTNPAAPGGCDALGWGVPHAHWGGGVWLPGWLPGAGVMQGSERGGQGGPQPSPLRTQPRGSADLSLPAAGCREPRQRSAQPFGAGAASSAWGAWEAINLVPE